MQTQEPSPTQPEASASPPPSPPTTSTTTTEAPVNPTLAADAPVTPNPAAPTAPAAPAGLVVTDGGKVIAKTEGATPQSRVVAIRAGDVASLDVKLFGSTAVAFLLPTGGAVIVFPTAALVVQDERVVRAIIEKSDTTPVSWVSGAASSAPAQMVRAAADLLAQPFGSVVEKAR